MTHNNYLNRICRWFNLPAGLLIALLQRSPLIQASISAAQMVFRSPAVNVLRATIVAAASLGAVDTVAGATDLTATTASPLAGTTGTAVTTVAFGVTGTQNPAGSWSVGGSVPPGLAFYNSPSGTVGATTSGIINTSTLYLRGTPTTAGSFTVNLMAFENASGSGITSPPFTYTINVVAGVAPAPVITLNPQSYSLGTGSTVTFYGAATGTAVTYQWQKNGAAIAGATSNSLLLASIASGDAGSYTLVATNSTGSVTSTAGTLAVVAPVPGRLINLSVRSQAGTGDQTLIAGFVATGTQDKILMIRGSGPTLANFSVPGFLADPTLDLFTQGTNTVLTENLSWGSAPNQAAIVAAGGDKEGAFALDPKDTIILQSLPIAPAGYSVQIKGADGGTGVALAEVFDEDPAAPGTPEFAAESRLINISARSQVGVGANVLIAGFVINGNMSKKVMIRASGPTLTNFGVTGVLADPVLSVFSTLVGNVVIASNDNWGDATNQAEIVAAGGNKEGTFALDPKDSVVVITLPPGAYTAQVAGVSGGTGVALIEVYDLQ